jgi:hypothetical protein
MVSVLLRERNGVWAIRCGFLSGNELKIRGHVMYGLIKLVVMRSNANSI